MGTVTGEFSTHVTWEYGTVIEKYSNRVTWKYGTVIRKYSTCGTWKHGTVIDRVFYALVQMHGTILPIVHGSIPTSQKKEEYLCCTQILKGEYSTHSTATGEYFVAAQTQGVFCPIYEYVNKAVF